MRKTLAVVLALFWMVPALAQTIIGTLPFTLQNNTIADANQVMADFNAIVASVNSNGAAAGANTNITALNGLTTPLVYTSGGTSNYIGGTSSGSANAQVIASPIPSGFTLVTGKSVTFIAGFTNNGPTQLNVNGTGLTNVFRQTSSGVVAMAGGEIVTGQIYTAVFDGTQFQIQGSPPQSAVQPCTVIDWVGANGGPSGYLRMDGTLFSRTTFAALFSCLSFATTATTSTGSASVVVPTSGGIQIGWFVSGNNVTCNSTVTAVPDGTHITISANAGGNGATNLTIGPFSQGDCSTTFAVGNYLGRATMMRDSVGSTLTTASCTGAQPNPSSIGTNCGAQVQTLTLAQLPTGITSTGTLSVTAGTSPANVPASSATVTGITVSTAGGATNLPTSASGFTNVTSWTGSTTGTLTSNNTSGNSHPILPPVALVDKYIKF